MGNKGDAPHKDQSFGSDAPVHEADHVVGVKYFSDERKLILVAASPGSGRISEWTFASIRTSGSWRTLLRFAAPISMAGTSRSERKTWQT
jgi:hypothetical protein